MMAKATNPRWSWRKGIRFEWRIVEGIQQSIPTGSSLFNLKEAFSSALLPTEREQRS